MNVVGLFTMVSKPVACQNDEPAEDDEAGEMEDCGRFQEKFGQPLTIKILWSALSKYEQGSELVNIKSLVGL